jgi:hypothetical protein
MAAMGQNWVEMKTRRVETGWFYAAPAVLNSLTGAKNPVVGCRREKRQVVKYVRQKNPR